MSNISTFEDLAVYKLSREFRIKISQFCKSLPGEEKHRLKDQMIRASRSITANIAEGFGRHHHLENAQFCRHSRGSLTEMLDHINCAKDEEYISMQDYNMIRSQVMDLWKVLNGYIAYLQRCADHGVPGKREESC